MMDEPEPKAGQLGRRALLSLVATAPLAACASITPDQLGAARADWQRRRQEAGGRSRLTVQVTNVASGKGSVHVGLYDASTPFPDEGKDLAMTATPADGSTVTVVFTVPEGTYALAAFQDLNGNGRLDTVLGIPREPFGFSNGATVGLTGTPSFQRASFTVNEAETVQTVRL